MWKSTYLVIFEYNGYKRATKDLKSSYSWKGLIICEIGQLNQLDREN